MKDLLFTIVSNLVDNQDCISINEITENGITTFEVKVADSDVGKIIGKQGQIAKAIRTVLKAAATFQNKKVLVKIL